MFRYVLAGRQNGGSVVNAEQKTALRAVGKRSCWKWRAGSRRKDKIQYALMIAEHRKPLSRPKIGRSHE